MSGVAGTDPCFPAITLPTTLQYQEGLGSYWILTAHFRLKYQRIYFHFSHSSYNNEETPIMLKLEQIYTVNLECYLLLPIKHFCPDSNTRDQNPKQYIILCTEHDNLWICVQKRQNGRNVTNAISMMYDKNCLSAYFD